MFQKIAVSGLIAGFGAGLFAALLQFAFLQPLLMTAEGFELGIAAQGSDVLRGALSVAFSGLIYCGYGLILSAGIALAEERGMSVTAKRGIVWGVAGFVVFQLAPAFGMPAELPGMNAGAVDARQVWWFATVFMTGFGLWIIAFAQGPIWWGIAAVLLVAPHLIGAPMPSEMSHVVPSELAAQFAARSLGVGMAVWALMGLLLGQLWHSRWAQA